MWTELFWFDANPYEFDDHERAFVKVIGLICQKADFASEVNEKAKCGLDCWDCADNESDEADQQVQETVGTSSLDEYIVCNELLTTCYVDKSLLGMFPGEAVRSAWSGQHGVGIGIPLLIITAYYVTVLPWDHWAIFPNTPQSSHGMCTYKIRAINKQTN